MKYRTNFVSNSSSSSYLIVIDNISHEKILEELRKTDESSYRLFRYILRPVPKEVGRENLIVTTAQFSTEGNGNYINEEYFTCDNEGDYCALMDQFLPYYKLAEKFGAICQYNTN